MILLSGASGGLGQALIPSLLALDDVIGLYHRHPPVLAAHPKLHLEKVNIADEDSIRSFIHRSRSAFQNVSLLHFAAQKIDGLTAQYKTADWDTVMNVNLKGNFLLCREIMPLMIQQNWGRIVHVSSFGVDWGSPGTIAYAASKSALLGLSNVLAQEGGRFHVTSNILSLGIFDTGLTDNLRPDIKEAIRARIPSKTFGHVENIAHAIEFLIKSHYVNGSVINIDGALI